MELKLKIFSSNEYLKDRHPSEILSTPVEVLNGLVKEDPIFVKGVKTKVDYTIVGDSKNVAISQSYSDVVDDKGFLIGVDMKIEWFDENGNPSLQKIVRQSLPISEASETIRSRRKRQINYLQEAGVRLGVKDYIDKLFNFYSTILIDGKTINLLNNYIENGSKNFENAINSETDKGILQILKAKLPDGLTVKQSILNQIT